MDRNKKEHKRGDTGIEGERARKMEHDGNQLAQEGKQESERHVLKRKQYKSPIRPPIQGRQPPLALIVLLKTVDTI